MDDARETILKYWAEAGKKVIEVCSKVEPYKGNMDDFLSHCTACGGNWGGMLLSGIREIYPEVWEAIPDDMGTMAWACICSTLILCGITVQN